MVTLRVGLALARNPTFFLISYWKSASDLRVLNLRDFLRQHLPRKSKNDRTTYLNYRAIWTPQC